MRRFRTMWLLICTMFLAINIPISITQDEEYPVITADNASAMEQIGMMGGDQGRISLSPDNHWMAIGGLQGVWVVDLDAGDESARLLKGHTRKVNATLFNPTDSNRLVSVSDDGTIREWNVETGETIQVIEAQTNPLFGVDIDSTGLFVAVAGGAAVRIFDLETGEEQRVFTEPVVGFRRVAFLNDSPLLVAGTFNSSIAVWNLTENQLIGEINNNFNGDVRAVRTTRDGSQLAVAMMSGRVITSTLATGEQLVLDYHTGGVRDVAFSPNGRLLASVGMDGKILIMDANNGALLTEFEQESFTYSIAFSNDSRLLYVASGDAKVTTWDMENEQIVQERSLTFPSVRQVVYSPDGRLIAAVTDEDSVGRVFDANTNRQVAVLQRSDERVFTVAFRPDSRVLVTAGSSGDISVWRADTFALADTLTTSEGRIYSLAFAPDPNVLISGGESFIRLWNLPRKQEIMSFNHGSTVWGLAVSPDGSLIAASGGMWNAFTRESVSVEIGEFAAVAMSPNSDYLATTNKLIPIEPRRILPALEGSVGLNNTQVAFNPDGTLLARVNGDNIQIIEVETQTIVATLTGHTAEVRSVTFSPDGTELISGGFDATIRKWAVVGDPNEERIPPIQTDGMIFNQMPDDIPSPSTTEATITAENIDRVDITYDRQAIANVVDLDVAPDGSSAVLASLNGVFYIDLTDLTQPPIAMLPTDDAIFPSGLAVDYAVDGTQVVVSHGYARSEETIGGGITLWDITTNRPEQIDQFVIAGDRGFSVALSPNKAFIALGFNNPKAQVLDIASARLVSETQSTLTGRITGITFSPDNQVFSLSDTSGNKAFFNTATGDLVGGFNSGIAVPMLWSPDNTHLYSPERSSFVLRDGYNTEPIQENDYPEEVRGDVVATDVSNGQLVIATEDMIWFLDYQTGDITQTITGFESIITTAEVTPHGQQLIAVTSDNRLRIWNIELGLQIGELELGFIDPQADIAVSDDGQYVAIGNRDISIRILSGQTGETLRTLETRQTNPLYFLPHSAILAAARFDNTIEFWDVGTGRVVETLTTADNRIVDISDDGTFVVTRRDDDLLTLQNVRSGTILFADVPVHLSRLNDADISIPENLMATAGGDGVVKLWDLNNREQHALIRAHDNGVDHVAFSPSGTLLATMGSDGVRVYDYRPIFNIVEEYVFALSIAEPNALYFSLDGSLLFAHIGDTLHVWSMDDGRELATYILPDDYSTITADGTRIIGVDTQGSIYSLAVNPESE